MEENSIIKDKKDKMLMIVIGCLSVVLILLFIFFLVERSENKKPNFFLANASICNAEFFCHNGIERRK